jgi:hypothetical protein
MGRNITKNNIYAILCSDRVVKQHHYVTRLLNKALLYVQALFCDEVTAELTDMLQHFVADNVNPIL